MAIALLLAALVTGTGRPAKAMAACDVRARQVTRFINQLEI